MDDIRDERESSLTEREQGRAPAAPERKTPTERRKIGPEDEVRGGHEAPEPPGRA